MLDIVTPMQFPECSLTTQVKNIMQRLQDAKDEQSLSGMEIQFIKNPKEEIILEDETVDPLGANKYQVTSRMVHQYKNRVLLLTTGKCFSLCRHCFRRDFLTNDIGFINDTELKEVTTYLENHSEVEEILLSGGDVLTGTDKQVENLIIRLKEARPNILIRICTRAITFMPNRFTFSLISILKANKPLWVIPHINQSAEISERFSVESRNALSLLIDNGIPMQSQTVLLKGVNDSVSELHKLFQDLTNLGVKPGYLFQGDLAKGTSHLRVLLKDGLALYNELKKELSGLSLPQYVLDIPQGGGKINLLQMNDSFISRYLGLAKPFADKGDESDYAKFLCSDNSIHFYKYE